MAFSKKKVVIVVAVIGVVAYYLLQNIRRVSVGSSTVRVHKVNFNGVELRVTTPIINESNLTIDVIGFLGQLFYKGMAFGTVTQVAAVKIPSFSTGSVEFSANLGLLSLGQIGFDLFNVIKADWKKVDWSLFTIKGTLKAEGLSIPINQKLLV